MDKLVFRLHGYDASGNAQYYAELVGVSGEDKPTTGLVSGSRFLEVDTGKTYVFDGISDTAAWNEVVVTTAAST